MSYTITNNIMYVRDGTGELVPVSMIASGADQTIQAIKDTATTVESQIDAKVADANAAIVAKTDEQAARIPEVTTLAENVSTLKDEKLDKTPGTWPEWTADEQTQARERMGIPGDYELIEEITISEAVKSFIRESTPDGTPYSLAGFFCVITSPGVDNAVALNQNIYAGGTSLYNYGILSVGTAVNAKSVFFACVNNKILHAEQYSVSVNYEFTNVVRLAKKFVPDGSPITKVTFAGDIPANTKITIYGVRA